MQWADPSDFEDDLNNFANLILLTRLLTGIFIVTDPTFEYF